MKLNGPVIQKTYLAISSQLREIEKKERINSNRNGGAGSKNVFQFPKYFSTARQCCKQKSMIN